MVFVIEDVHWADRATSDLLSFLARNLRDTAVLLVVTFRSDDLHRDHPLRQLLAGLERIDTVSHLDLPRLSRDQVAAQVAGILGRQPAPSIVNAIYARGGGNPLFTEALLNPDGTTSLDLPWTLRELLLTAVKDLPEQAQQLLRTAAVGGHRLGHAMLAAVTGLDDVALTAGLRPAVAANVLVADADGYAFRHELIREAVLADLLPGERAQAHRRLRRDAAGCPSLSPEGTGAVQVARHWLGAREIERAMTAAWRAADQGRGVLRLRRAADDGGAGAGAVGSGTRPGAADRNRSPRRADARRRRGPLGRPAGARPGPGRGGPGRAGEGR